MHGVIGSRGRVGCNHSRKSRTPDAEAYFLPFYVPARDAPARLDATILEVHTHDVRVASVFKVMCFEVMDEDQSADEEKHHYPVEEPSLSGLTNHPAECVSQCCRQEHDREHF